MPLKQILILISIVLGTCLPLMAQTPAGTLRIQVLDPSGASVLHAVVVVKSASGDQFGAQANKEGIYEIKGLAPGLYSVQATAQGFTPFAQAGIEIAAGKVKKLEIHLQIEMQQEEVEITEQSPNLSVSPTSNVSALVIKGADLDALSDDPEELAADLQALAGPAAGPSGGEIYIDGFTGGRLPPKSAIREIRINQNPFSAQFDRLGYGRTEIFTKPGGDKLHGRISANFNNSVLNSRNPFVLDQPGYHSERFSGDLGGALSKKASFFFSAERRNITDSSIVSAYVLDSNFNPVPFNEAVPNPRTRTEVSPRIDYQVSPNNVLTVRYQFDRENEENNGIGLFSLPSQGFDLLEDEHTIQVSDTQIFGTRTVNETRFRYQRQRADRVAQNFDPTLRVLSAFTGGGNNDGTSIYHHSHYELQNYTSITAGRHLVKFGGRLQVIRDLDDSNADFNGTFTFGSLEAYRITELGLQQGWTPAEIRAAGGGANQFSMVAGNPRTGVTLADVGIYLEDDWRLRPNLSLSLGMRYETQNEISDHADFAPRVSLAWGLGRASGPAPKTVLRAGWGLFYDRFGRQLVLQARRLNGLHQRQFVVPQPDFYPSIPDLASLAGNQIQPTIYQIDPALHSPHMMQSAVSLERQLSKTMTASLTYVNTRGWKQLLTRNINAPLPGTYDPANPTSGIRPLGDIGNIYQYEAAGIFRQNQWIANFNVRGGRRLSLFSNYTLNYARGNTSGASSFPVNQYDLMSNYGRAQFDVRHRAFLGGTVSLPYAFSLNSFIIASSGMPFDINLGQDLNGDSIFNDRPAIATDLTRPSVVQTAWGNFDTRPAPGEVILAPNFGTGPHMFMVNMRLSKTFGFGKPTESSSEGGVGGGPGGGRRGPGGGPGGLGPRGLSGGGGFGGWGAASVNRRYNLTLSVFARNIFNFVNLAAPVGNLSSPLFGRSNALAGGPFFSSAANRRIDFQVAFSF